MSDSFIRSRAIRKALDRPFGTPPKGNFARNLNTLAFMINGIIASNRTNLPAIASKAPVNTKQESVIKKISRWIDNFNIKEELYFMPFAIELLAALSLSEITLAMDGSTVGRNCICLMVSVIYKNRALPLAWFVIEGSKGHLPEIMHLDLIDQVHKIVPDNATVVFVGDGEFDGVALLKKIESFDWFYVCRTGKAITYYLNGEKRKVGELQHDISGEYVFVPTILFTSKKYPSSLVCCWEKCYKEPIFLVTNFSSAEEASRVYKRRFKIETFFSDQKSRGFNLHKSHLEDSIRISRLMIAACLAYIWVIYWGANSLATGLNKIIHRTNRCDISLFQLGLRTLDYFLNRGIEIPVPTHALL